MGFVWQIEYVDGSKANQFDYLFRDVKYKDLRKDGIKRFNLLDERTKRPVVTLRLEPNQKLIYRKRHRMAINFGAVKELSEDQIFELIKSGKKLPGVGPDTFFWLIGFQERAGPGVNVQSILCVFEDPFHVIMMDRWREAPFDEPEWQDDELPEGSPKMSEEEKKLVNLASAAKILSLPELAEKGPVDARFYKLKEEKAEKEDERI